jgi:hypothetical protein
MVVHFHAANESCRNARSARQQVPSEPRGLRCSITAFSILKCAWLDHVAIVAGFAPPETVANPFMSAAARLVRRLIGKGGDQAQR